MQRESKGNRRCSIYMSFFSHSNLRQSAKSSISHFHPFDQWGKQFILLPFKASAKWEPNEEALAENAKNTEMANSGLVLGTNTWSMFHKSHLSSTWERELSSSKNTPKHLVACLIFTFFQIITKGCFCVFPPRNTQKHLLVGQHHSRSTVSNWLTLTSRWNNPSHWNKRNWPSVVFIIWLINWLSQLFHVLKLNVTVSCWLYAICTEGILTCYTHDWQSYDSY